MSAPDGFSGQLEWTPEAEAEQTGLSLADVLELRKQRERREVWQRIRDAHTAMVCNLARFALGDRVRYYTQCGDPIGNGATVTVVRVDLDHGHARKFDEPMHPPECYCTERLEYDVAYGYDPATGKATLRWRAPERELFPL